MFLIRTAFWLGIVVMLLPTDEKKQETLIKTASNVVERTMTFCERNPGLCKQAGAAWEVFKAKAAYGARLAQTAVMENVLADKPVQKTSAQRPAQSLEQPVPTAMTTGTLESADLTPGWRGRLAQR